MAGLPGEVEQVMLAAQKLGQAVPVAHIGQIDVQFALKAADIAPVAAVFGNQAVEQRDLGAERHKLPSQVGSDEAEPAGDEYAFPLEGIHE